MTTEIELDDELVAEAIRVSGIQDLNELIAEALRVLIAAKRDPKKLR